MQAIRICITFLFMVLIATHEVCGQDNRFSERIKNVAITLDSSALSNYAPFDLAGEIDSNFKVLGIGEQSHLKLNINRWLSSEWGVFHLEKMPTAFFRISRSI